MWQRSSGINHHYHVRAVGQAQLTGGFYTQLRAVERMSPQALGDDCNGWEAIVCPLDAPDNVPMGGMQAGPFRASSVVKR